MHDLFSTPQLFKLLFWQANYELSVCANPSAARVHLFRMSQLREWAADARLANDLGFHRTSRHHVLDMSDELACMA